MFSDFVFMGLDFVCFLFFNPDFFLIFLFSKEKEQTWRWVGRWGMSCDKHRQIKDFVISF